MQVLLVAGLIETQLFKVPELEKRLVVGISASSELFTLLICEGLLFLFMSFEVLRQDQSLGGFAYGKYGRLAAIALMCLEGWKESRRWEATA